MKEACRVIYIMTNPSFPQFVKIGYADDVEGRVAILNNNPGLPYCFRIYATYEVIERLEDLKIHRIIDTLNPTLRCQEEVNGKSRVREFLKAVIDDKAKYTDWSNKSNIKASLQSDVIRLLNRNGYPPMTFDDVYQKVLAQVENFKKYED